jgi:hypothetical protein
MANIVIPSLIGISLHPKDPNVSLFMNVDNKDLESYPQYNEYSLQLEPTKGTIPYLSLQTPESASAYVSGLPDTNLPSISGSLKLGESRTISETAYSINSSSLNVPSLRKPDSDDITDGMKKFEIVGENSTFEVPNNLKKYDGIPMFFEMVDSSGIKQGIQLYEIRNEDESYTDKFIISTLKLTPNPDTLTINSGKKINRYTTLAGWVEEHWGEEIDTVNFNGSTFSFFTPENGITNEFRDKSSAYRFLRELIHYYQINGCVYQGSNDYEAQSSFSVREFLYDNPEFVNNHPRKGMIKERLYVKLYYDYLIMYGRFETFDIIEDSTFPFRFKYNIVFKAERTIYNLDSVV